jgi:hypothetical protein
MTRQQVIDYIAENLWTAGIGNKAGGRKMAELLVEKLIERGVLVVTDQ